MEFVIGIDLGSTGIRGIVTNSVGKVILSKQLAITPSYKARQLPAGWYEQNPESWIE
ncbi:MAG: FGGY family carbohydrate kinase, partial [Candidatus Helarchaeota archaeon]